MTLELSQVFKLKRFPHFIADVGPLASAGADYLKSNTAMVQITGERLNHFFARDRMLTDLEIITMSYGLQHGLMIGDELKPNCLVVNYINPDSGIRYKCAIKSAKRGEELWVSTLHRLRPRQTKPLLRRGIIVKTHT